MQTPAPLRKRFALTATVLAVIALSVGGAISVVGLSANASTAPTAAAAGAPVDVAEVVQRQIIDWQSYSGRIEAVDRVEVRPLVGGTLTAVHFKDGALVKKGDVLFTIDPRPFAAEVARADAQLAQANLERAQRLLPNGFVSKADIDQKTATRDAAVARVRVAESQLSETRARNNRLDIRSPAAGLVLTRSVEPGQIISSGSGVLFRVASGGQMELRLLLSEADMQKLHIGVPAEVSPVGTSKTFKGEVWQVSPVIDPTNRQGVARIALSYDPALRPGGFASAKLIAGAQVAPQLPQSAVQSDERGNYVYILDAQNRAVRTPITTGDVSDAGIVITSGLKGNERVVVTAGAFLTPGQKVIPVVQKAQ